MSDRRKSQFDEVDERESENAITKFFNAKLPFDLTFAYSLTYGNNNREKKITGNSIMASGNFDLSPRWKGGVSTGDDFVQKGLITPEQGEVVKKTIVSAIKDYQQLETDLDTVVNEPIIHLQSVDPNTLIELTKTLSTGANKDKYWNGDKNVKGVAQLMTTSKKHMAYLPDGHATPPTEVEMMQGFIKYASDTKNTLTQPEQKVLSELSNKTNGPNLGPKVFIIPKK
jgi:hypothetical protein